ncbi:MAG TPA: hypothetical protein VGX21_08290 [Methylomirabilota bacterium]|nr:hypothetical protein [Methylomirabilota bacterium]
MEIRLGSALEVTATEQWRADLRAGRAMTAGMRFAPALGEFPHIGLRNPGSGKILILRSAIIGISGAVDIGFHRHDTTLTTAVDNGHNLLSSGPTGQGQLRSQSNAANLGTVLNRYPGPSGQVIMPVPEWGYELASFAQILFTCYTVDTVLYANFWWAEV